MALAGWRWLLVVLVFVGVCFGGRLAYAQGKGGAPIQVLTIDSDDAEDQADALSIALRSRARTQAGWTVSDATPSLALLTAANKCPARPDAACAQKIADTLKTDRFIWGVASKPSKGQVNVEVHLYVRGKPETVAKETFSDALKDPSDEGMKRVANRIVDRLAGTTPTTGTVLVQSSESEGNVLVDGVEKSRIEDGRATIELPAGKHTVEVRAPGYRPSRQEIDVVAGAEATIGVTLSPEPRVAPPPAADADEGAQASSGSGRRIVGWALIGLGVAAAGFGVYETAEFVSLKSKNDDFRAMHQVDGRDGRAPPSKDLVCAVGRGESPSVAWVNGAPPSQGSAQASCDNHNKAFTSSVLGWVAGGVAVASLGIGTILLLTDSPSQEKKPQTDGSPKFRLTPTYGPRNAGLDLHVTF